RVLEWIIKRLDGATEAVDTPIGRIPAPGALNFDGLDISDEQAAELFAIDRTSWLAESELTEAYYDKFGDRIPAALRGQLAALRERLARA
ncbi:MAG: phosphoenolpyruvate carboxykinase domain-containing protein, partial [Actinomycetota bacterium]|nr:phosphoenolpyruvate carboxykinase domain-containing protein [Actinomycetota bacterium]